jgi:hypothetical protein
MSEVKDLVVVEQPAAEAPPPPPPSRPAPRPPEPDFAERLMLFVELRPWTTAAIIFGALTLLHIVLLNVAGLADGPYVEGTLIFLAGSNAVEIILLAFIAFNIILPTLMGRACIRAYDALRPALMLDDRAYGETRAGIIDPFIVLRLGVGLIAAAILTPLFGAALATRVPPEGVAYAVMTIWIYVRIALIFGLLGASSAYVLRLHQRFRQMTRDHLRVDLFDLTPLAPIVLYGRQASLYLLIEVALLGPAVVQPEALAQVSIVFATLLILAFLAVVAALLGARRSIQAAKKTATTELGAYARELWRRAYAGQRIVEAVAIPALGAMISVRNEIKRLDDWPGGWSVFTRFAALVSLPLLFWFGPEIAARLLDALGR